MIDDQDFVGLLGIPMTLDGFTRTNFLRFFLCVLISNALSYRLPGVASNPPVHVPGK